MDFSEINRIKTDKTSCPKKAEKKTSKNLPENKNPEIKETSPANPSYWQNAVGINKQPSFKNINFSNTKFLSDEPVNEEFFNETAEKILFTSCGDREAVNGCLEKAKDISKYGQRALSNYVDLIHKFFKYMIPAKKSIEMTNLIFDKIPKFSVDYVEPLGDFLYSLDNSDEEGFELVKDCINAVISDTNTDNNAKMSWISFHMPLKYHSKRDAAGLVVDFMDNYKDYAKFIKYFKYPFRQKDVSMFDFSKEQMNDLSFLIDKGELNVQTFENFIHSNVYNIDKHFENSSLIKQNVMKITDIICNDKDKLELFNEITALYPKQLCLKTSEMLKVLNSDTQFSFKMIEDFKSRPENVTNGNSFIQLFNIIDKNNIDKFIENTRGLSEFDAYNHAHKYLNPTTYKYDGEIADFSKYLMEQFKMIEYTSSDIAKESVDRQTGEISPVAEDFIHFIKRDEKNIPNMLMHTGFVMTKQLGTLFHIEVSTDRETLKGIIHSLKNNEGGFEETNLQFLKKLLMTTYSSTNGIGENYRVIPKIINSLKDDKGVVDKSKYINFKKILSDVKSFSNAYNIQKALSSFDPKVAEEVYSTIMKLKVGKHTLAGAYQPFIKFAFDENGNQRPRRFNFVKNITQNINLFYMTERFFNMCSASQDNINFVKEIAAYAKENYRINLDGLGWVYEQYKDENGRFPQIVKDKLTDFAKNQIPINYFIPLCEACFRQDETTGNQFFDDELFDKIVQFMSIEQRKTKNTASLSPEMYIGILTNTLDVPSLKFKDKVTALNAVIAADKYNTENNIKGFEYFPQLITNLNSSISSTKSFVPVKDEYIKEFISNAVFSTNAKELTPFEKVITDSIPDLENMTDGLQIKYSREDFLTDLSKICEKNPLALDILHKKAGMDVITDDNITIRGYNGIIHLDELNQTDATEKQIYDCLHKFMYENEVQTGNKELDAQLNNIIKTFPEFINTIGKKQHGTQKYTLDVHQLLVMAYSMNNPAYLKNLNAVDKSVLKLSALFHDIMKQENVIDNGHQYPSALYARSIIQKVVKNPENRDRIYEMINNHHWLGLYAHAKDKEKMEKELAFSFRRPNDFEIAKIMADSDLKAVSEKFYTEHKDALNNSNIENIAENLEKIYANGNALFTDYFVMPSKLDNHIERKDGKEYKVVNFNNIDAKTDLSEYGFDKGITKEDLNFLVHMVDGKKIYDSLNIVKMLASPVNGGVLSESVITPKYQRTYCDRKNGVLLSQINTNIINENKRNQGSGREKDMDNVMSLIFEYDVSRQNFRKDLLRMLNIAPETIDDEEYAEFYKNVLASKTSLNQINPEATYNIADNLFSGKDLKNAIKAYQNSLIDKSGNYHNEIVGYVPKIQGVISKAKTLSQVPDELLKFAYENNLPVILI